MSKAKRHARLYLLPIVLLHFLSIPLAATSQPFILDAQHRRSAPAPALQDESLEIQLAALPGASIVRVEVPAGSHFLEAYKIRLEQPLDHQAADGARFEQVVYLSHAGFDRPVVLITEGYSAPRNYASELSRMLGANQVLVEHRYFGESKPEAAQWQYLTVRQAADDHHRIVNLLKDIYTGKWVSTGISKGGQTALVHRCYYPDDVAATVAYVAPMNRSTEDERIDRFFDEVGDVECRRRIREFQFAVLDNRELILPKLAERATKAGLEFSIGLEATLEYAVLEYPFSFWQMGRGDCDRIPPSGSDATEMFEHLREIVSFTLYADAGVGDLYPAFYQFFTELGYYGFITEPLGDRLRAVKDRSNAVFAPKDVELEFRPEVMRGVIEWLEHEGNNIIYVYGAQDPWSASAVNPSPRTNAFRIMHPGGSHGVRIRDLTAEEREAVYSALEQWLDMKLDRPAETGSMNQSVMSTFDIVPAGVVEAGSHFSLRQH